MDALAENRLTLRFYDPKQPDVQSTSATALTQSVEALQRLVHLVAMRREGRTPGKRIRPSTDIQARYQLICEVPKHGSFLLPVRIEGADLLAPNDARAVVDDVEAVLAATGAGDEASFTKAVPDETWRRFYLDALEQISPPAITGVELEIKRSAKVIANTVTARSLIARLARGPTRRSTRGSIVGEFKRIDFQNHEITIRHVKSERELKCFYQSHVEESLLEHPRELLLVFGTVTRDEHGQPHSIADVDHIEPVNLDPEKVEGVAIGNLSIAPREPISADVTFDEEDAVYVASIPTLRVLVYAEKRESLRDALNDEIVLLWKRYATAQDNKLTRAAQALKQRVLEAFTGETDAA